MNKAGKTDLPVNTRIRITFVEDDKTLEGLTGKITHPFSGLMSPGVEYVAGVWLDSTLTDIVGNEINLTACDKFVACSEEFNNNMEKILHPENITDEELKAIWDEFGDTPINDDETIDEAFYIWPKGTDRFDVWHWFDEYYSKGVAVLSGSAVDETEKEEEIKKMIEAAEKIGWTVRINKKDFTFSKFSPAGQDFNIEITADNFVEIVESIKDRCDNFDCSEETYLWLDSSGHGTNGAPYDMKDLYNDMEACLKMLEELHEELSKLLE